MEVFRDPNGGLFTVTPLSLDLIRKSRRGWTEILKSVQDDGET